MPFHHKENIQNKRIFLVSNLFPKLQTLEFTLSAKNTR